MNDPNIDIEMKDKNENEILQEEQPMQQHNQQNIIVQQTQQNESKQGKLNNNLFKQLINIYHVPLNNKKNISKQIYQQNKIFHHQQ